MCRKSIRNRPSMGRFQLLYKFAYILLMNVNKVAWFVYIDLLSNSINDHGMSEIKEILIDMTKLSPIQVYRKHGIGIRTQDRIKESVVENFMKDVVDNCCVLCKKELQKRTESKIKPKIQS